MNGRRNIFTTGIVVVVVVVAWFLVAMSFSWELQSLELLLIRYDAKFILFTFDNVNELVFDCIFDCMSA